MSTVETLVHRYIQSWNETDARRRRALVEGLYTPDARYTDPLGDATGWDTIEKTIEGVQAQFAGLEFSLAGAVDAHHDTARFTWHLGAPGAVEPLVIGFDVIAVEEDRIREVHGFLDRVPTA